MLNNNLEITFHVLECDVFYLRTKFLVNTFVNLVTIVNNVIQRRGTVFGPSGGELLGKSFHLERRLMINYTLRTLVSNFGS